MHELDALEYYRKIGPKSLGKEWVLENFFPVLNKSSILLEDKLRTFYQHITRQIKAVLENSLDKKMLITGGGAHNLMLMELFQKHLPVKCVIPDKNIVDFKEAIVFAFLGVLRMRGEVNCLRMVTGASIDNVGGVVFEIPKV